ncbi:MAG TPA: leucine-rich repeat domain-containing protein [Pirellulales bacterium]|jgi:Leucine-rich repeat (LRR) protein|nr:leucine-rich repeat domain-containing protein [Pirellulales bacterium]
MNRAVVFAADLIVLALAAQAHAQAANRPRIRADDPAFAEWKRGVASMPADQQIKAVTRKLAELNPKFDGELAPDIDNGVVTAVALRNVTDISPLRALPGLRELYVSSCPISDLNALRGARLTTLHCGGTRVANLSPLKGMPLRELYCDRCRIADLSPLSGMPLTDLDCSLNTELADLSPLKGVPLETLNCSGTRVSSLSALKGAPLRRLDCRNTKVSDISPLNPATLEELDCAFTDVSDFSHLAASAHPLILVVGGAKATDDVLDKLRRTLPACVIRAAPGDK